MRYFAASMVIAVAAAVYGLFSHGVYSYYMTYAFMIPLLGGALPYLIAAMRRSDAEGESEELIAEDKAEMRAESGILPELAKLCSFKEAHLAMIVTLTAGSLLKGVLDIYGTTNRLLIVYPVIAALILAATVTVLIKRFGSPARAFKNIL